MLQNKRRNRTTTFNSFVKENYSRRITARNILVLYRDNDSFGKDIADYYKSVRNIPDSNVMTVSITNSNSATIDEVIVMKNAVRSFSGINSICSIVLCGDFPNKGVEAGVFGKGFDDYLKALFIDVNAQGSQVFPKYNYLRFEEVDRRAYRFGKHSESLSGKWGDSGWQKIRTWDAGISFNTGEFLRKKDTSAESPFVCEIGGITGSVEFDWNAPSGSDGSGLYWDDGTIRWRAYISGIASDFFTRKHGAISGYLRYPLDFKTKIENTQGDIPTGNNNWELFNGVNSKLAAVTYTVSRLTSPAVHSTDSYSTRLDLVKAIIDRGIAFEKARYNTVPGTQIVGGDVDPVPLANISTIAAIRERGDVINQSRVFWKGMAAELANTTEYPSIPDNNFQAGDTHIQPVVGGTFTPVNDCFFHFLGNDSYFNNGRLPFSASTFSYYDGAITLFGRSCGMAKTYGTEIDFDVVASITQTANPSVINLVSAGDKADLKFQNQLGGNTTGYSFTCTLDNTSFEVTDTNEITLTDSINGTTVLTVPSGSPRSQYFWFESNLPIEWTVTIRCTGPESRTAYALRHGACVAFGALQEPMADNSPIGHNIVEAFLYGHNLAEVMRLVSKVQNITSFDVDFIGALGVVGDPLYRPFGHFERSL